MSAAILFAALLVALLVVLTVLRCIKGNCPNADLLSNAFCALDDMNASTPDSCTPPHPQ